MPRWGSGTRSALSRAACDRSGWQQVSAEAAETELDEALEQAIQIGVAADNGFGLYAIAAAEEDGTLPVIRAAIAQAKPEAATT